MCDFCYVEDVYVLAETLKALPKREPREYDAESYITLLEENTMLSYEDAELAYTLLYSPDTKCRRTRIIDMIYGLHKFYKKEAEVEGDVDFPCNLDIRALLKTWV